MTKKKSSHRALAWFQELLNFLVSSNLIRAQKGNLIFDALAVISFISLLATKTESEYKVICFIVIVLAGMWCHSVSAPVRKK